MGLFQYNNPLIVFMVRIANMIIVSLYWVICCLGVVTVLPACAALYHTVNKVVFGNGNGVTREYFKSFKAALKPGVLLSAGITVVGGLVAFGVYTGLQIWDAGVFGTIYMAAGILIGFVCLTTLVYVAPTLSRFEGGASIILRLSMYFSMKNQFRSAWYVLLLALAVWVVDFFPLLLLVVPALYVDLTRGGTEKVMNEYIRNAGLEEEGVPSSDKLPEGDCGRISATELDKMLSGEMPNEQH